MAEHKYPMGFYAKFFTQEVNRIIDAINDSTRLKFRFGILLFSLIYALCTGFVVYVKDYIAGDQAMVPMFLSLIGVAISSFILVVLAIIARFQSKREWSREFIWSLLFLWLIYVGVLTLFAKFTT